MCEAVCLLLDILVLSSFLSSKRVISGWQEAYLGNSELLTIDHAPDVSPVPDPLGVYAGGGHMDGSRGRTDVEGDDERAGPTGAIIDGRWRCSTPGRPIPWLGVSGLGSTLPGDAASGDSTLAPGSSNTADPWPIELGLPGYPSVSSPPANWRPVEGSTELACS
jgi:hypothetical protein